MHGPHPTSVYIPALMLEFNFSILMVLEFCWLFGVVGSSLGQTNGETTVTDCPDLQRNCPPYCVCVMGAVADDVRIECQNSNMTSPPPELPECGNNFVKYYLNFSWNSITEVGEGYNYNGKLVSLDISNNLVRTFTEDFFNTDTSLVLLGLYLHGNQLRSLPSSAERVFKKHTPVLTLYDNPWRCDCNILWLRDLLKTSDDVTGDVICESPENLANQSLTELNTQTLCSNRSDDTGLPKYAVVLLCLIGFYVVFASFLAFFYTIRRRVKVSG